MTSKTRLGVHFGALCDPIREQVNAQGLTLGPRFNANTVQEDADAITRLLLRGYISDSVAHRARQKLMKLISRLAHKRTSR